MAEGVGDIIPQHEYVAGNPEENRCRAEFDGSRGNTWQCGMPRSNDIHLVDADEGVPIASQHIVNRHAEKQGISYNDAWRHFEREGYDMSDVAPQYTPSETPEPIEATGLDEHDVFTVPVDAALSVELRKLEQQLDGEAMRINSVPTEHCKQEAKRIIHTSMRLSAIAWALEEGRLQIHPRTIDHQVARAAWEMDQQIPTTEDGHAH